MDSGFASEVVYEARVYDTGSYHAHMRPEAVPYMINAVDNMLRTCAASSEPGERARFNALRREMFRLFPEQAARYISDPVAAMRD